MDHSFFVFEGKKKEFGNLALSRGHGTGTRVGSMFVQSFAALLLYVRALSQTGQLKKQN